MDRSKLMNRYFVLQTIKWVGFNFSFCLTFRDLWKKSILHSPTQFFSRKSNTHVHQYIPTYNPTNQPTPYFFQPRKFIPTHKYKYLHTIKKYFPQFNSFNLTPSSEKLKVWLIFLFLLVLLWINIRVGQSHQLLCDFQ